MFWLNRDLNLESGEARDMHFETRERIFLKIEGYLLCSWVAWGI